MPAALRGASLRRAGAVGAGRRAGGSGLWRDEAERRRVGEGKKKDGDGLVQRLKSD